MFVCMCICYVIVCISLIKYFLWDLLKQGAELPGIKALQNVEMLVDLISISLEADSNESANFSVSAEFISK